MIKALRHSFAVEKGPTETVGMGASHVRRLCKVFFSSIVLLRTAWMVEFSRGGKGK